MFPFGSFLSGIPLVVFATAYFIYCGASFFNKVRSEDVPFQKNESAKIIKAEHSVVAGEIVQFHKLLTCETGISNDAENDLVQEFPDLIHCCLPEGIILAYSGGYNLFSRPPPIKH